MIAPKEFWVSLRAGMRVFGVHRFECPNRFHRSEYIDLSRSGRPGVVFVDGRTFGWDDRPIVQLLEGLQP